MTGDCGDSTPRAGLQKVAAVYLATTHLAKIVYVPLPKGGWLEAGTPKNAYPKACRELRIMSAYSRESWETKGEQDIGTNPDACPPSHAV
ncbi:hypothetical protein KF707_20145 [Candidatus Obscuribacterales bacterium]|nr:hypothetical protein [Candidatus Obscuribacterales bacterium]